jgi:N-acetylmuramoyl-L-alanine amidase
MMLASGEGHTRYSLEHIERQPLPASYRPRVVIKFRDGVDVGLDERPRVASASNNPPWNDVRRLYPGARVERLWREFPPTVLTSLARRASRAAGSPMPDLQSFVAVSFPPRSDTGRAVAMVRAWDTVEHAYVEAEPAPPPVSPDDDPRYSQQRHLRPAPEGVNASAAWRLPGGDGQGVGFVDLEQGWTLGHEDLVGGGITLISGLNHRYEGHGTAVLGVVLGQDNTVGGIGIAPSCSGRVVSEWRDPSTFSAPAAIIAAATTMSPGDVLLLEAQRHVGGSYKPVSVEFASYVAILIATALGIVVVEAAGNGGTNLDDYRDPVLGYIFKRGHEDFRDSGSIMVGSCSSASPHVRRPHSNYGSRIDCHAWGENIVTTDGTNGAIDSYRTNFSGTSGASAIVAGLAVVTQGLAQHGSRRRFNPAELRAIFGNRRNGTPSASPPSDRIGAMPDLQKIISHEIAPVGDFPTPRRDVQYASRGAHVVIDPGHGGVDHRGGSSPFGVMNRGVQEKHVNLRFGQRIAGRLRAHLPVTLTRDTDRNLSLGERIDVARRQGAAVFLSLHADERPTQVRGSEIWVHEAGGSHSHRLADTLRTSMGGLPGPTRLNRAPMAVLDPLHHAPQTAACLVELDDLSHVGGARRLSDEAELDRAAEAMCEGVLRYIGLPSSASYGSGVVEDVADLDGRPRAEVLTGPPEELASLLRYLRVGWETFAEREDAYFEKLTEHLVRAGVVEAGTALGRSNFAEAVASFQRGGGLTADGLPGEDTLWALQQNWALQRRLGIVRVPADRIDGSRGYDRFRLRSDIVDRYDSMRREVLAAGGVVTSAGSFRELGAEVTPGRSPTSMHYSGLAFDLATDTGMRRIDAPYIITQEGRRWRVWCRSDAAAEQQLEAVLWSGGRVQTRQVTARAFDFTATAARHGFASIGPRRVFPSDYRGAEWWHFQCEAALTPWISQFGVELLSLSQYNVAGLSRQTDIWNNRKRLFKRGRSGWH